MNKKHSHCEHGRRKRECRNCGGSAFCEHSRIKYQCRDCIGSAICEHRKVKYRCIVCDTNRTLEAAAILTSLRNTLNYQVHLCV